jgi:hypothetical protein
MTATTRAKLAVLPLAGALALAGCQAMQDTQQAGADGAKQMQMAAKTCSDAPVPGNTMAALSAPEGYDIFTNRLSGYWYTQDGKQAVCSAVLVTEFDAEAGTAKLIYGHGKQPAWGYEKAGHTETISALMIEDNGLLFRDPATHDTITLKARDGRVAVENVSRGVHGAFASDPRF